MPYVSALILTGSIWRASVLDKAGPSDAMIELVRRGRTDSVDVLMHERGDTSELTLLIVWLTHLRDQVHEAQDARKENAIEAR